MASTGTKALDMARRALYWLGALAAAEVIQHIGARPAVTLKALAAENGLPV